MDKLPKRGGLRLCAKHSQDVLDTLPDVGWLHIEAEDYFGEGGSTHHTLQQLAERYPLSMSCLGLSIGSAESPSKGYLSKLRHLNTVYRPSHISTPLCWSRWQGQYFEEPLPLPLSPEASDQTCINIKTIQNFLGRRILIQNPALVLDTQGALSLNEFFNELIGNTGCGILLDINYFYMSCVNRGLDPYRTLEDFPIAAIREIHLSGHEFISLNDEEVLLVKDHSVAPLKPVWQLFRHLVSLLPHPWPSMVNWQGNTSLAEALEEMYKLNDAMNLAQKSAEGVGG